MNMRDMNSQYPWFDDGDLIVHFPGMSNVRRLELMDAFLQNQNVKFDTGTRQRKDGLLANDLHDWRVRPGLMDQYRGAGWNIACDELTEYYA